MHYKTIVNSGSKKIKDISAFWRPELGGNADPDVQGNLGNAPDTAPIGQNGGAAGGVPSSQLIECDPASANLSGQTQTPTISGSFAAALMVGVSREHSSPSLVSPPLRVSGLSGPLQGSGTLVNPSSV